MKQWGKGFSVFTFRTIQVAATAWVGLAGIIGCNSQEVPSEIQKQNWVKTGNPNLIRTIGDESRQFRILGTQAFDSQLQDGGILPTHSISGQMALAKLNSIHRLTSADIQMEMEIDTDTRVQTGNQSNQNSAQGEDEKSLLFGMPVNLLNQPMLFGATITQVSDRKSQDLGMLKLTSVPPMQVLPVINQEPGTQDYSLVLILCNEDCSKLPKKPQGLVQLPVLGYQEKEGLIITDLAPLGEFLDLQAIFGSHPVLQPFKTQSSRTTTFDFSNGTLVFDVETKLTNSSDSGDITGDTANKPEGNASSESKDQNPGAPTTIVNRWYMMPTESFNPKMVKRGPTEGVGFFTSSRGVAPVIHRWDFDRREINEGIKYYIKNVPAEYQAAFAGAFEDWNQKLFPIIGKKVFSYEFISENDPRNELLVTGDVRYNVVEWDLNNKAGYGGLGPSIAHPYTGEITQASILVQGPTIVKSYTRWYQVSRKISELRKNHHSSWSSRETQGDAQAEAETLMASFHREMQTQHRALTDRKFQVRLGKSLTLTVPSQLPSLEDPMLPRDPFEFFPENLSFKEYMDAYFRDMLTHELGHNLGLRHNFKGNLGASEGEPELGKVSRSIMEYLSRTYRHLDQIGEYDLMAIAYGYAGELPQHTDWFCTDEDLGDLQDESKSAECSRDDATSDPFSYFQNRLAHATDLLLARGHRGAPTWTVDDLKAELETDLNGIAAYAVSAEKTSSSWSNFYRVSNRPKIAADIRSYALDSLRSVLCDPTVLSLLEEKTPGEPQLATITNLVSLRETATSFLSPVFSAEELACSSAQVLSQFVR